MHMKSESVSPELKPSSVSDGPISPCPIASALLRDSVVDSMTTPGLPYASSSTSVTHASSSSHHSGGRVPDAWVIEYHGRYSQAILGATSGCLFAIVAFVAYCCYNLAAPYMLAISSGILLSIVMHPKSSGKSYQRHAAECEDMMKTCNKSWSESGPIARCFGAILSIYFFVLLVLMQGVHFLGLQKLNLGKGGENKAKKARVSVTTNSDSNLYSGTAPAKSSNKKSSASSNRGGRISRWWADIRNGNLEGSKNGRDFLRVICVVVFIATSTMLVGVIPLLFLHLFLFGVFVVLVHFVSERTFISVCGKLWRSSVLIFLFSALAYSFLEDSFVISNSVHRATSVGRSLLADMCSAEDEANGIINCSGNSDALSNVTESFVAGAIQKSVNVSWGGFLLSQLQQRLVDDIALALDAANVTQTAVQVREAFEPLMANLTWDQEGWRALVHHLWRLTSDANNSSGAHFGGPGDGSDNGLATTAGLMGNSSNVDDALKAASLLLVELGGKWKPLVELLMSIITNAIRNVVNIFDAIYGFTMFVFVYRFLTTLPHTLVYYLVSKILVPMHPVLGERHARNIEHDITVSFRTLLQSFWHITWLHFSVTFCCFKFWEYPSPFFCGLVAVVMALFPLMPKWFSPCGMALGWLLSSRWQWPFDGEVATFLIAFVLVLNDDWLLSVERGLRGVRRQDASGVMREQLPTFIVGTCIILGLVAYGIRGVVLGPLTVIVARTIFDNWDVVSLLYAEVTAAGGSGTQSASLPSNPTNGGNAESLRQPNTTAEGDSFALDPSPLGGEGPNRFDAVTSDTGKRKESVDRRGVSTELQGSPLTKAVQPVPPAKRRGGRRSRKAVECPVASMDARITETASTDFDQ